MIIFKLLALFFCTLLLLAPQLAFSQTKRDLVTWSNHEVHWKVEPDGSIRGEEVHTLILNGPAKTVTRYFNLNTAQTLSITDVIYNDPFSKTNPYKKFSQGNVLKEGYFQIDQNKMTWYLENTSIEPFRQTPQNYIIKYLIKGPFANSPSDTIHLKHVLAMPERSGVIKNFLFTLDPGTDYTPIDHIVKKYTKMDMPPGQGFPIDFRLLKSSKKVAPVGKKDFVLYCTMDNQYLRTFYAASLKDIPDKYWYPPEKVTASLTGSIIDGFVDFKKVSLFPGLSLFISSEETNKIGNQTADFFHTLFYEKKAKLEQESALFFGLFALATINVPNANSFPLKKETFTINEKNYGSYELQKHNELPAFHSSDMKLSFSPEGDGFSFETFKMPTKGKITIHQTKEFSGLELTVSFSDCQYMAL